MVTQAKLRRIMSEVMTDCLGFAYEDEIQEMVDSVMEKIYEDDEDDVDPAEPERYDGD